MFCTALLLGDGLTHLTETESAMWAQGSRQPPPCVVGLSGARRSPSHPRLKGPLGRGDEDEFQEPARAVRSRDEVAGGVLADFFDGHGVA